MGKLLYRLGYFLFKIYFFVFDRPVVKGQENIPEQGPLIVMANHQSFLDPPLVGITMKRQVFFLAKEELFKNVLFGCVLKKIGVIPLKRGRTGTRSLRKSLKILSEDKVLGLFPEGTRSSKDEITEIKPGAVFIALKSKAPILPVGINNINGPQKLKVSIGPSFNLDSYYDRKLSKEEKKEVADFILNKIAGEIDTE